MKPQSKKLIASVLSFSLAFSPLTPVSYAMADEADIQEIAELESNIASTEEAPAEEPIASVDAPTTEAPEAIEVVGETESADQAEAMDTAATATENVKATSGEKATGIASGFSFGGKKKEESTAIDFVNEDGDTLHRDESKPLTLMNSATLGEETYVLSKTVTFEAPLVVTGKAGSMAEIVLCDDAKLICNKGIEVRDGMRLHIYTQEQNGAGKVVATTSSDHKAAISVTGDSSVIFHGGTIEATAKTDGAAGIGGDKGKASGNIMINGGTVKATGASHGAGIGGGQGGRGNGIVIYGGTVEARGGDYAAGIGAGGDADAGTIKIGGGNVKAWGGKESAGIGAANKGYVDTIDIFGGRVWGIGGKNAAGIGGGDGAEKNGTYGHISISGEGTFVGGYGHGEAAGIGTGNEAGANDGIIDICDGANVEAVGSIQDEVIFVGDDVKCKHADDDSYMSGMTYNVKTYLGKAGAGIGGGDQTQAGTINISGEKTAVTAYGGENAAAIGSGDKADGTGEINITGGYVYARGGAYEPLFARDGAHGSRGAGIGGGRETGTCSSGVIRISGASTIDAIGGDYAAGIGGGDKGGIEGIFISDSANIKAQGGKCAAGIGTGDVSDNGSDVSWRTGTIEISGANTKIDAKAGSDGAAGIGGGKGGHAHNISIKGVGMSDGATGSVSATGSDGGSGIGGGPAEDFGTIDIENSAIMAVGAKGAGIGTGAGSDSKHVEGGKITIKDSEVVAMSAVGGAGIGGGQYGRADSVSISGGTTMANGGTAAVPGEMGAVMTVMMKDVMKHYGYVESLEHLELSQGMASETVGTVVCGLIGSICKFITGLLPIGGSGPKITYCTGAGIGGGYKSDGGYVTIKDDAIVNSAAGLLPPGQDAKVYENGSASIGAGKEADKHGYTTVKIYDGASVTTAKGKLEHDMYDESAKTWNNTCHMSDIQTNTPNEAYARVTGGDTQSCVIIPSTMVNAGCVVYDANGGEGVMNDQVFEIGKLQRLRPNAYTRKGYWFKGWCTTPDGKEGIHYGNEAETSVAGHMTLYAIWEQGEKVVDLDECKCSVSLSLDEQIGVNLYVKDLPDDLDPADYSVKWWVGDDESKAQRQKLDNTQSNYVRLCDLNATQLTEPIHIRVMYMDGCYKSRSFDYSVRDYCESKLKESSNPQVRNLCLAVLDYGACAQKLFGRHTDDLANKNYLGGFDQRVRQTVIGDEHAPVCNKSAEFGTLIERVTVSAELKGQTGLRFYVTPKAGVNADDIAITFEDEDARGDADKNVHVTKLADGRLCLNVTGIKACDLGHKYDIIIKVGDESMTMEYSVLSYCYSTQKDKDQKLADTSKALYNYWKATKAK